jgi:hypothetical protein
MTALAVAFRLRPEPFLPDDDLPGGSIRRLSSLARHEGRAPYGEAITAKH